MFSHRSLVLNLRLLRGSLVLNFGLLRRSSILNLGLCFCLNLSWSYGLVLNHISSFILLVTSRISSSLISSRLLINLILLSLIYLKIQLWNTIMNLLWSLLRTSILIIVNNLPIITSLIRFRIYLSIIFLLEVSDFFLLLHFGLE